VVPVGQIEAEESAGALRTSLTRAELARYPEFSPSAFTAMDDGDALRYERRLHRVFAPDSKPYDGRPVYENLPLYRTPTWLMTGVWMSEASGFAVTPPRADCDATGTCTVEPPERSTGTYERTAPRDPGPGIRDPMQVQIETPTSDPGSRIPDPAPESELMIARGESDERDRANEPREPRIERYREL